MGRTNRKYVNLKEDQYTILSDYASSKGITMGEAIQEMTKDIQALKDREFDTIFQNAINLCDMFEAMTSVSKLPEWMREAIRMTVRPIILQGILLDKDINLSQFREVWNKPPNMKLIVRQ